MGNILENIIALRKEKGISQENIAESIDLAQGTYSQIETGKLELKYKTLLLIADVLKLSVHDIIAYPNNISNNIMDHTVGNKDEVEAILQIKLRKEKKDQVLNLIFGENIIEILNK